MLKFISHFKLSQLPLSGVHCAGGGARASTALRGISLCRVDPSRPLLKDLKEVVGWGELGAMGGGLSVYEEDFKLDEDMVKHIGLLVFLSPKRQDERQLHPPRLLH